MEVIRRTVQKLRGKGLYLTRGLSQPTIVIRNAITNAIIRVDFVGWHHNKKFGPQIRLKIDAPDEYKITRPERAEK